MRHTFAYLKLFSLAFACLFVVVWMDRVWVESEARGQADDQPRPVTIAAEDFAFKPNRISARPGQQLLVTLVNRGQAPHAVVFEVPQPSRTQRPVQPGESATLSIVAPMLTGDYAFYCPIGNHRERGMVGRLVVEQ